MSNGAPTKQTLIAALQDLYTIQTKVNHAAIMKKRLEALETLKELKLTYREGYDLFKQYAHSVKEFNVIMTYAREVLI